MTLCQLCKKKEAETIGSHLLTNWLIASAFKAGKGTRDHELIFKLSNSQPAEIYVGRSISTEKIEEQFGRQLSDEEIELQKNEYIRKEFLCSECEKRFKVIEDEYLRIHEILNNADYKQKSFSFDEPNNFIIRLFWFSQLWRSSACKLNNFDLGDSINEYLRVILDQNLKDSVNVIVNSCDKNTLQITELPIIIYKAIADSKQTSNFVVFLPGDETPFTVFINDYVVLLYLNHLPELNKRKKINFIQEYIIPYQFFNYKEKKFTFGLFDHDTWCKIKQKMIESLASQFVDHFTQIFNEMVKRKFEREPTQDEIQKFRYYLINNENRKGDKYTKEAILEAMNFAVK